MSSVTSKRLAGHRLALEVYALVVVVLAASIVVATYAYSLNRWHDGNGSPLKDRRRAAGARAAADDQELARALRAPEQVRQGIGVAAVAAVAQNYPPSVVAQTLSPSSSETLINKMYPLVIKGESPILAEAWWPISAGYEYGTDVSSSIALA